MTRRVTSWFAIALVFLFCAVCVGSARTSAKGSYLVYVGTYTGAESKGIYVFRFDTSTGKAGAMELAADTTNPSFVAIDPTHRFLYAANEIADYQGQKSGGVSAFAIDGKSGKLTFLNEVPSSGAGPCYVSLDKTGKFVLVANYDSGSVAVFPVLSDGKLGEASAVVQHHGHGADPKRQEGPHAHEIEITKDNRFAVVSDLGLDELLVYRFDAAHGTLAANDPPFAKVDPGAGPRHFAFTPNKKFLYVINEMGSTITGFSYDASHGVLRKLESVSTLPSDFKGENDTAEIEVYPSGKFLYGSNRGHDSIALFSIDSRSGRLNLKETTPTGGKTPRNFAIDPTGAYLFAANQGSNTIVIFRIDKKTGHLTPTGDTLTVTAPVCIRFLKAE